MADEGIDTRLGADCGKGRDDCLGLAEATAGAVEVEEEATTAVARGLPGGGEVARHRRNHRAGEADDQHVGGDGRVVGLRQDLDPGAGSQRNRRAEQAERDDRAAAESAPHSDPASHCPHLPR